MPVSVQDVVNVAPDLLSAYAQTPEGQAAILRAIAVAEESVDECIWGARYEYAVALLAAHHVLSLNASLGGIISGVGSSQSDTVGGVSTSISNTLTERQSSGLHGSTRPGLLYDEMLAGLVPAFFYTNGGNSSGFGSGCGGC